MTKLRAMLGERRAELRNELYFINAMLKQNDARSWTSNWPVPRKLYQNDEALCHLRASSLSEV